MGSYDKFYHKMPDGTVKQINPFNGTEVWSVAERGRRPAANKPPENPERIIKRDPEDYCHFCEGCYIFTPPEKARIFKNKDGKWEKIYYIEPENLNSFYADFRRVGNLFEIVTYDYWKKNYNYKINEENKKWMDKYLSSTKGFEHIMNILKLKKTRLCIDFDSLSIEEKIQESMPFFAGCHELIIGRKHYINGAEYTHQLCSSGELTEEEHYQYIKFSVETIVDLFKQNPFIRYVSVFQNWLKPAGASFDHIHKQFVGLDEWGVQIEGEIREIVKNPNIYNEFGVNFAIYNSLLVAENEFAIAIAEIGHRFPTVAIYSKSVNGRPFEHSLEEIRGMSDLVHAIHCALTSQTTVNEEWYYTPFDSIYNTPWRILIKLRINTPAGFEGNTKIYINPLTPEKLKEEVCNLLYDVRDKGLINKNIKIGDEVQTKPNPLQYYKGIGINKYF